jgi:hypothetical protein
MSIRRVEDYQYSHIVADPDHFIYRYICYAGQRTSAAWDYHEAAALMLLAAATQGIRWRIPAVAGGLKTNLYLIFHGRSSKTKKSTVMDIAEELLDMAMPHSKIPENYTPGAFEEILAEQSGRPSVMMADEFQGNLERMMHHSYMAGLKQMLLTLYSKDSWSYRRVSKGKNKDKDILTIEDCHLCIIGNTTPAVADLLQPKDILDGFLARFGIIYPGTMPRRFGLREMTEDVEEKNSLAAVLRNIRDTMIQIADVEDRHPDRYESVIVRDGAIDIFDKYEDEIESWGDKVDEMTQVMYARLPQMAWKVAMLISAGRPRMIASDHIEVTEQDAQWACTVVSKWRRWAARFVDGMTEEPMHKELSKINAMMNMNDGKVYRRDISRRLKLSKYKMDELELTMLDRGVIRIEEVKLDGSPKPTKVWVNPDYLPEDKGE